MDSMENLIQLKKHCRKPVITIFEKNIDHIKKYEQDLSWYQLTFIQDEEFLLDFIKLNDPCLIILEYTKDNLILESIIKELISINKYGILLIIDNDLDEFEDKDYLFKLGITDYLQRPISTDRLRTKISSLLHEHYFTDKCRFLKKNELN